MYSISNIPHRCLTHTFNVTRCSDEGRQLKVTEVGEKPLKRDMLDTNVRWHRQTLQVWT